MSTTPLRRDFVNGTSAPVSVSGVGVCLRSEPAVAEAQHPDSRRKRILFAVGKGRFDSGIDRIRTLNEERRSPCVRKGFDNNLVFKTWCTWSCEHGFK